EERHYLLAYLAGGTRGVLIGENGYCDLVIGQDDILGDEAGDFSTVLDDAMSLIVVERDAESVVRALSVLQLYFGLHFLVGGRLENGLIDHGDVPLREVGGSHVEFAGCEHPSLAFQRRDTRRTERVTKIANGVGFGRMRFVDVEHAVHAEGTEDVVGEELQDGFATDLLDDGPGDGEVGVAVLPLGAGIEVERLARPL